MLFPIDVDFIIIITSLFHEAVISYDFVLIRCQLSAIIILHHPSIILTCERNTNSHNITHHNCGPWNIC